MTLIQELSNNLIPIVAITAFGWYLSHFAKNTIPRLLFITFGAYFAILGKSDLDTYIGLGFLLPHIKFFFAWVYEVINSIRKGTLDLYYTMQTIFYQTRNMLSKIYSFFTGKESKKGEKSTDDSNGYYEEEPYREYEDFGQNSSHGNKQGKRQQEQESYSNEESNSNYEEPRQEQSYQEQKKPEDDIPSEYKQFFSDSAYTILGVSPNDDFKTIKKKYRTLIREYHPDKYPNDDMYTKIAQQLNGAYEKLEKIHKPK